MMSENSTLLITKIQIPPLPYNVLPRSRLHESLDDGLLPNIRLILLSAPAGYGKTTSLNTWIEERGTHTAWLSLDEGDNDPIRFMNYLLAALKRRIPELEIQASTSGMYSVEDFCVRILNPVINKMETYTRRLLLVFDDYHLIQNQTIHECLDYLLDNLPAHARVIIATRAEPPIKIARMRGRGQVKEMRMEDLRFQSDEARAFLDTVLDLKLTNAEIDKLNHRTEGWISGLKMAAASIQGHEEKSMFIEKFSGSHRHIMDYLLDEVLRQQTPQRQQFLLNTSVLPRLTGSLCDALMTTSNVSFQNGSEILSDLERENLFIVPLDDNRDWYRYHRLFSDLLQARLKRKHPERSSTLHRRASQWFEDHNLTDEAVQQAILTRDTGFAADLIERVSQEKFLRSELMTFLRWLQRLPEEEILKRPKITIYRAWALLFHGAPLDIVEAQLQRSPEISGPPGSAKSLQAFIALSKGEIKRGLELTQQALLELPADEGFLRDFTTFCAVSAQIALGEIEDGINVLKMASQTSFHAGNMAVAVLILTDMAELRMKELHFPESEKLYQQALTMAKDEGGELLPIAGGALFGLGILALERYDLNSAEELLLEGIHHTERWSLIATLHGHLYMAMLHFIHGRFDDMEQSLDILHNLSQRYDASEFDDIIVEMFESDLKVRMGDIDVVRAWLMRRGLEGAPERKPDIYLQDSVIARIYKYELPIIARLYILEQDFNRASMILEELERLAEQANRPLLQIDANILAALVHHATGDSDLSVAALQKALEIASPQGVIRPFLMEGEEFNHLLKDARSKIESPGLLEFLDSILQKSGFVVSTDRVATAGILDPLSPRELEVLQLLPTGLTADELATELIISVNTVRSHMKSIYTKLGVHSRHEAVLKASELDLI